MAKAKGKALPQKEEKTEEKKKFIIRICRTDVDGSRPLILALQQIKGVGWMFAHAVCAALELDPKKPLKDYPEEVIQKIEDCLYNPTKYGIPNWLLNRRRDPITGEDKHIVGPDVDITHQMDVRNLIKIRCYRGWRHENHLPVRGKRTHSGYTFPPYRKHRRTGPLGVKKKTPGGK